MKFVKKILWWLLCVFTVLFLIINIISIINTVILKKDFPNIFGYTYFEVASNSMYPTLKKKDLIIIKLKSDDYAVGDIITYRDKYMYTTHRLLEINSRGYITKGDNNNTCDPMIKEEQIVGKVVFKINYVGYLIEVIKKPIIIVISFFIILLIFFKNN